MKYQIEEVTQSDLEEISTLSPEGWGDIGYSFTNYLKWSFAHPVKITKENQIVALGCVILHDASAWLAHIIVKEECRKQGLGSMMVGELLRLCQTHKREIVSLIATVLGRPVYEKHGFVMQSSYVCLQENKDLQNKSSQNKTIQNNNPYIVSPSESDIPELLRLDEELSGEQRSKLLLLHLEGAFQYKKDGCIRGMFLPSLGQGMILAKDAEAGTALLSLVTRERDMFCFPEENKNGIVFLENKGFEKIHTVTRMIWGKSYPVELECIYARIGGNLG